MFKKISLTIVMLLFTAASFGVAFADSFENIENPKFEYLDSNALPSGWYTEAWHDGDRDYSVELDEVDGERCLHIVNNIENDTRLCQRIAVEPDSYYKISCMIRPGDTIGGAGANISVVGTFAISEPIYGTGWQNVELVGHTDGETHSIVICMRLGGYSALTSGEAWFKDISVTKLDSAPVGDVQDFYEKKANTDNADPNAHNVNELHSGAMLVALLITAVIGAVVYRRCVLKKGKINENYDFAAMPVIIAAFILRLLLSLIFYGHSTDIVCFMAWSNSLAEEGLRSFYSSGMFADYPPGYMYILWLIGGIARLLRLEYGGAGFALIVKMPSIICDLAAAYIVYDMAKKRCPGKAPLALMCMVAFNPAMAFISGAWGQIDQILTLQLLLAVWLFDEDKIELAGLAYGIAIITKPQALMAGPLFAIAYLAKIKDGGIKYLLRTLYAVAASVAVIFIMSLPFKGEQPVLWFMEKLIGTATSYPYASIEAFNMMALLGGNWKAVDAPLLGLTYGKWGTIMIAASCIGVALLYLRARGEKYSLSISLAFLLTAIFSFGQYMHERYLFPALMLIMAGFILCRDRRLIISFIWLSCSLLLNSLAAFVIVKDAALRGTEYEFITMLGSMLTVGGCCYFGWISYDILVNKAKLSAFSAEKKKEFEILSRQPKEGFTKRDKRWCIALTAVYAAAALLNLGTMTAPETAWQASAGESVDIFFAEPTGIDELRVFGGLYEGSVVLTTDSGETIAFEQANDDMFRWKAMNSKPFTAERINIQVTGGRIWFNELGAFDENGNKAAFTVSENGAALNDEQNMVPDVPSYMNGMYFDELYHGRTAYEHLHGIDPYENSHPPLGKVFIMLGIAIFGMNTLGWRIIGTLFGIGMVPIMYAFGKRLFRRSEYALLAAGLFAFDFMHYTQTRIATIDVYGVFFIILMYYFMYEYYCMNFYTDGLNKTLKPLGLAGLFFGLGAASKWICIYAGGGLAVILFTSLFARYGEYRHFKNSPDRHRRELVKPFWKNAATTLLWCCVFYIAVPAAIYLASYIPYVLSEKHYDLQGIWGVQEFMYSYHSGLTATHPYESPWWQWPLDLRPVWYYISYYVPEGKASTISAFGNPAVWWVCSAGAAALAVKLIRGSIKPEKGMFVLLCGLAAEYLPWVLVTRCTFAYHYFASVPFIILLTVYIIKDMEEKHPDRAWVKWAWLGLTAVLFAAFYPVISGAETSAAYVRALEWLPGWTFLGY